MLGNRVLDAHQKQRVWWMKQGQRKNERKRMQWERERKAFYSTGVPSASVKA